MIQPKHYHYILTIQQSTMTSDVDTRHTRVIKTGSWNGLAWGSSRDAIFKDRLREHASELDVEVDEVMILCWVLELNDLGE